VSAIVPAPLVSRCRDAVARAAAYIRTRQSPSGGFCFYRYGGIDEPNLGDTYYAVAGLRSFGIEVPIAGKTADFVSQARLYGLTYLYFCCFSLEHLGLACKIPEEALAAVRNLSVAVPEGAASAHTSGWLESVRKTIRLQQRFTPPLSPGSTRRRKHGETPGPVAPRTPSDYCHPHVVEFVARLMKRTGLGVRINLWDTCVALSVGALLGLRPPEEMATFIDSLQKPPLGFLMTPGSVVWTLDVAYAGARCSQILGLPVRYHQELIDFTLSCQSSNGGFAHAPMALANLEFTYFALRTLAILVPESTQRTA
jgi:hypothetical protein